MFVALLCRGCQMKLYKSLIQCISCQLNLYKSLLHCYNVSVKFIVTSYGLSAENTQIIVTLLLCMGCQLKIYKSVVNVNDCLGISGAHDGSRNLLLLKN